MPSVADALIAAAYTKGKQELPADETLDMTVGPMKRERILVILAVGFALVILCLAAASYLGFRHSRNIQLGSAELVKRHIVTGRSIDELQTQQQRLSNILVRVARLQQLDGASLEREVESIDGQIRRIATNADATAPSAAWKQLSTVATSFATEIRSSLKNLPVQQTDLDRLTDLHERFVQLSAQVVKEDATRSAEIERHIQIQSSELIRDSFWLLGGSLLLALACAVITIHTTNSSFRQMEWQARELSRVSWHMLEGQEVAARRFSHEMHDELGQSLTGLKAMLLGMRHEDSPGRRAECVQLLDEAIGNVRELSQLLHPVILDDFGLDAALRWVGERFTGRTRIEVHYESNLDCRLADEIEMHFFRITQEALTNVARHSGATQVHIAVELHAGVLRLSVEDNGNGMPVTRDRRPSVGMIGMRARAQHAGGELTVGRSPLGGVKIEAWTRAKRVEDDTYQENARYAG
jgi:signal transduction histidine kinase